MKNGYSLLVVIIALVIFATGILSIIALLPSGQQAVRRTVFYNRAAAIAEKEFAFIRVCYSEQDDLLPPEEISGEEPDGFRWAATIKKSGGIYLVTLTVYSKENGKEEPQIFTMRFVKK
jgi:Tfp pilus assembly protein PilV